MNFCIPTIICIFLDYKAFLSRANFLEKGTSYPINLYLYCFHLIFNKKLFIKKFSWTRIFLISLIKKSLILLYLVLILFGMLELFL